jgi:hypothetical protein
MNAFLAQYLSGITLGEPQQAGNLAVFPLFAPDTPGLEYLTLTEALPKSLVTIAEISEGGSVPNIKVTNQADSPLLLFDGEELIGCKQNRILNTSILLRPKSEAFVPVSCTEAGRWQRKSPAFNHSGHVSPHKLRMTKAQGITESLKQSKGHTSDQHAVWKEVSAMAVACAVHSPTSAMDDVFAAKAAYLEAFVHAIKLLPGQKGLLVLINGEVAGLDVLSLNRAYELMHPLLVKAYAMDALVDRAATPVGYCGDRAASFLAEARTCGEKIYETVGWGADHRFDGQKLAGSALVAAGNIIHLNLYRN